MSDQLYQIYIPTLVFANLLPNAEVVDNLDKGQVFKILEERYVPWDNNLTDRGYQFYRVSYQKDDTDKVGWVRVYNYQTPYHFAMEITADGRLVSPARKQYTLEEFIKFAKSELDDYQIEWSGKNSNEYHSGKHTWDEWWKTFHGYYNWEDM